MKNILVDLVEGFQYIQESAWAVVFTGLALTLTALGLTFLSEAFRDVVDPKTTNMRIRQL
jgi:peptide/nickel transport system permease protein